MMLSSLQKKILTLHFTWSLGAIDLQLLSQNIVSILKHSYDNSIFETFLVKNNEAFKYRNQLKLQNECTVST